MAAVVDLTRSAEDEVRPLLSACGWKFAGSLYPHQWEGAAWFLSNPEAMLYNWPMGTGKTLGTTATMCALAGKLAAGGSEGGGGPASYTVIIVAPRSLHNDWVKCITLNTAASCTRLDALSSMTKAHVKAARDAAAASVCPLRVVVVSPETLPSLTRYEGGLSGLLTQYGILLSSIIALVVDEAHSYRTLVTHKREAFEQLWAMVKDAGTGTGTPRMLLLTGTANYSGCDGIVSLNKLVTGVKEMPAANAVHVLPAATVRALVSTFSTAVVYHAAPLSAEQTKVAKDFALVYVQSAARYTGALRAHKYALAAMYLRQLNVLMAMYTSMLSYGDLLHKLKDIDVPVQAKSADADGSKDCEDGESKRRRVVDGLHGMILEGNDVPTFGDVLQKHGTKFTISQKDMAAGCKSLLGDLNGGELAGYLASHFPKIGSAFKVVTSEPKRYVVFSSRLPTLTLLHAALQQAKVTSAMYIGCLSNDDRSAAVDTWAAAAHAVLLMTYTSGGTGLNLQAGDAVVHLDVPTTQLLAQAEARVARAPRTTCVAVHYVQCVQAEPVITIHEVGLQGHTLDHAALSMARKRACEDEQTMGAWRSDAEAKTGDDDGQVASLAQYLANAHGIPFTSRRRVDSSDSSQTEVEVVDLTDAEDAGGGGGGSGGASDGVLGGGSGLVIADPPEQVADFSELVALRDKLARAFQCAICTVNEVKLVMVPCGHTICSACFAKVKRVCPYDRMRVERTCPFYKPL